MNGVRNRENAESEMLNSRFPVVKIFHIAARFLHRNGGFLDVSADDILQAECGMKHAECHILFCRERPAWKAVLSEAVVTRDKVPGRYRLISCLEDSTLDTRDP